MTRQRLQLDGRLTIVGPRNAHFELAAGDDGIEIRPDRLRSLIQLNRLAASIRPLMDQWQGSSEPRALPAVWFVVRGQRIANFDSRRTMRLLAARDGFTRITASLAAIRPGAFIKAAIRGARATPRGSADQQSGT